MSRRGGGYDGTADGQGAIAHTIPRGISRRGELRGAFVRTALAGRIRLPRVRQRRRGGSEEPGAYLRMSGVRPSDLDHGGHGDASLQAAVDGLVLGRASFIGMPHSKRYSGSLRTMSRRAIGTSSTAPIPAKAPPTLRR